MFKFKVEFDENGTLRSMEISIELPDLTKALAAQKLGISASQIKSIAKLS